MKILLFSILPKDLNNIKGGVESATIGLLDGLKGSKNKVLVYSLSKTTNHIIAYSSNIRIEYHKANSFSLEYLFYGRKKIMRLIGEFKPDIIHIEGNGPYLNIFKKIKNIPIIITPHAIFTEELKYKKTLFSKIKFILKKCIERHLIKKFKNFIFISDYNKHFYSSLFNINEITHITIPNPVNASFYQNTTKKYNNILIYVGAINRRKNILSLLKALDVLYNKGFVFKLNVCGGFTEEDYKDEVMSFLNNNSISKNVIIHGFKSPSEVISLYNDSSLFVLPSLQETLPISICEALAAGCPVIATNVGGVNELVIHGRNGFIYEPKDMNELVMHLSNFQNGSYDYTAIANNAREFSIRFKPEVVAQKTIEFYKSILNE